MVSASTGAAVLGVIAVFFIVAAFVFGIILCKLLGKCGFRRFRRSIGFNNRTFEVEMRDERQSKVLSVGSVIYEDVGTPKLIKKEKNYASKASLVSFEESHFDSVLNRGYRDEDRDQKGEKKARVQVHTQPSQTEVTLNKEKTTSTIKKAEAGPIDASVTYAQISKEAKMSRRNKEEEGEEQTSAVLPEELSATYARVDLVKKWSFRQKMLTEQTLAPPEPNRPPSDYIPDDSESAEKPPEPPRPPSDVFSETDESAALLTVDSSERRVSGGMAHENYAFEGGEADGGNQRLSLGVVYEDTELVEEEKAKEKPKHESIVYEDLGYEDLETIQSEVESMRQKTKEA